jgi:serine/threonine protein kinase
MEAQSPPLDLYATGLVNLESRAGNTVGGGRYSLVKVLGRGGMGIVWLARDARLNSEVALKFLPPQIRYDLAALDDLRRETARSRKLSHPNIIRIHDLYEAPNEDAFISMEYVEGRNLADLRVEQPARVFAWSFLKPILEQLCAGLEYAHGERIIHCDLKPANLMLDKNNRFKLADFGIARTMSDSMTRSVFSQTSGTLLYMSPQQMEGGTPRVTDDIYALGATLYELMTGKPPFYTGDIVHQVRLVSPRPMKERLAELGLTNEIPALVEQAIMACLSKNPNERPQSAADVLRLFNGEKIAKRARPQALANWDKKKWWWATAACVALAAGILAFTLSGNGKEKNSSASAFLSVGTNQPSVSAVSSPQPLPPVAPAFTPPVTSPAPSPAAPPVEPAAVFVTQTVFVASPPPKAPMPVPLPVVASSPTGQIAEPVAKPPPVKTTEVAATNKVVAVAPAVPPAVNAATPSNIEATNAAPVLSKATALQLLQKGNSHVSARSKDRVLEMISARAPVEEVPQNWRIIYYDDKVTYDAVEVRFERGEMARVYEPSRLLSVFTSGASKILDLKKVKIDSDQAIQIAVSEAATESLTAKTVELKLERGYGGLPVWNVKLYGATPLKPSGESSLGYVIVLAEDGKVLKNALSKPDKLAEKPLTKK